MNVARISELDRKATQSGRANAGLWILEFERSEPQLPDPLTGWNGSGDTNAQVRITFRTCDEAIAYAKKRGIDYHLVPATPAKLQIQAYSDNFR
ncbi:ETC complex I subunit [Sphingomonas sabuli]|uniref:ETC complex I subunit n=1 Tax=Sphingomonas sabuli TaxID=2764186 RepID=A0A7G9KZ99_9SPHN|nr:ETC complex I subunit [Sphingomonas sabuli]QNM81698.1 ETC complex I subunit [Sphingomonas sabuli]